MSEFSEAYARACSAYDVAPRDELLESNGPSRVILNGNCRERFQHRVTDNEVNALVVALQDGQAPCEEIDVSYNSVTDAGAAALAQLLRKNDTITALKLSFNDIGVAGARALADALTINYTLNSLDLSGNEIGEEGGVAVVTMLRANNSLQSLNLSSCGIRINTLIGLSMALTRQPSLRYLNIDKPLCKSVQEQLSAIQHLGEMIRLNDAITDLVMSRFDLTDDMLENLLPALLQNKGIQSLNLSSNPLSAVAGELLATVVRKRVDLTALYLNSCRLNEDGAIALAQALRAHPAIMTLDLRTNRIGERGLSALANMLQYNDTLVSLRLWGNNFTPAAVEKFYSVRKRIQNLALVDFDFHVVDGKPEIYFKEDM